MPPLWSSYTGAGHPYLSPAGTPSPYGPPTPASYCRPPPPNPRDSLGSLVLNPTNLSTGSRSLGSTESEGLPLYVPTPDVSKQQQQQSKPSTIVRNPTYQSLESPEPSSKVVMRQKKINTLDRHFRRSLGYENPIIKKRPATIAYHEVNHVTYQSPVVYSMLRWTIILKKCLAPTSGKSSTQNEKNWTAIQLFKVINPNYRIRYGIRITEPDPVRIWEIWVRKID